MHHPTDRTAHTTAVVTPVVEHWLERGPTTEPRIPRMTAAGFSNGSLNLSGQIVQLPSSTYTVHCIIHSAATVYYMLNVLNTTNYLLYTTFSNDCMIHYVCKLTFYMYCILHTVCTVGEIPPVHTTFSI